MIDALIKNILNSQNRIGSKLFLAGSIQSVFQQITNK